MDSVGPNIDAIHEPFQRSERSPEDEMISSYLRNRSEVYGDLVKVQDDVGGSNLSHEIGALLLNCQTGMEESRS